MRPISTGDRPTVDIAQRPARGACTTRSCRTRMALVSSAVPLTAVMVRFSAWRAS